MAKAPVDPKKARQKARDAYRSEYERRRAERLAKSGKSTKVPPFDPERFVRQLRWQAWASIHTVAYSAALTIVCVIVGRALGSPAWGAFAALLAIGSLYFYLLRVWDIDLTKLGKTTSVVGVFITYFITWIMVGALISNPPFYDGTPPEIHCCGYEVLAGNGTLIPQNATTVNATNGTAWIKFAVHDNSAVSRVTFAYTFPNGTGVAPTDVPVVRNGQYRYQMSGLTPGGYLLNITAWDTADHVNRFGPASMTVCTPCS